MEEALEAVATVIKFIGEAVVKSKCEELSALAEGVEQAARDAGAEALKGSGEGMRMDAVLSLLHAFAALERAACAKLVALRNSAASLARACREFREAAKGMEKLRVAKELRAQHGTGRAPRSGWLAIWGRQEPQQGVRENLLADIEKGHQVKGEDKRSAMAGYALLGSITLITYLGPNMVSDSVTLLAQRFGKAFHIVFSLWWTMQAAAVPLGAYARSLHELRLAQFVSRLGVLGINLLVIVFVYLALGIEQINTLKVLLGVALVFHIASFGLACYRGDLSK